MCKWRIVNVDVLLHVVALHRIVILTGDDVVLRQGLSLLLLPLTLHHTQFCPSANRRASYQALLFQK